MTKLRFIIVFFFITFLNTSFGNIPDIETTRLKSAGGAGVGSILLNEAAIFNPASIVFHSSSSLYYHKETNVIKNQSDDRSQEYKDSGRELLIISDTSSNVKGSFSVEQSKLNRDERFRLTSSGAASIGKATSIGFLLKYTEDNYDVSHKTFTQLDMGLTHIVSEKLSIGSLLINPTHSTTQEPTLLIGVHYTLFGNMDLILDVGATYEDKPDENTLQRAALQLKVFDSLYLRTAKFHDKIQSTQGQAWGVSWIGPKLSIEYAFKSFSNINEEEEYQENTLALVLVF